MNVSLSFRPKYDIKSMWGAAMATRKSVYGLGEERGHGTWIFIGSYAAKKTHLNHQQYSPRDVFKNPSIHNVLIFSGYTCLSKN